MTLMPVSPYAASKLATEQYAMAWAASYGLRALAFRFFNVFGPLQAAGHDYAAVVPAFVDAALAGRPLPVHGDGKQSRDFTYVSDAVDATRLACTAPKAEGEVFNVGTGNRVTVSGLLNILGQLLEREIQPAYADPRSGDIRHSLAEVTKAQEVLGYRPRVSIQHGLVKTLAWYRRTLGKNIKLPLPRPTGAPRETGE
jgi:UDP-glucose 4-epimerase